MLVNRKRIVTGRTLYAKFSPWTARALLIAMMLLVIGPALPHAPLKIPGEREHWWAPLKSYTDGDLYRDTLQDTEKGEGYYAAAAKEQRAHHYPTAPPQVFREPTLNWFLSILHFRVFQFAALFSIYCLILVLLYRDLRETTALVRIATIAAAVSGLSIAGRTDAIYTHEVWSALLIAASLLIYRGNRWWPSVILGALACLIRETALPYLLVMGAFALYGRRWRQAWGWLLAVLVFAGFFSWHISEASNFHKAGDLVSQGWLGFGGWNFVIATAKWNIVLHVLPAPLIALAICLGLLGLAGASDARARRAAVIVASYLAALLVIGRLDNYYWGILYTPLLPLGFIFAPQALRDLIERARPAAASAA